MASGNAEFRVNLSIFRGPLDLLLYLIRKHELAVTEISVAQIAEQFLQFVESAQPLDVDTAADYLAMASWLVELKSYELLPHGEEELPEDFVSEPKEELVRRLLEYKRYRDLAYMLEERARQWHTHVRRLSDDLGDRTVDPAAEPVQDVHLWDLVQAFLRVLQESEIQSGTTLVYDETPLQVFMERIYRRLLEQPRTAFRELFIPGMHKSTLVGMFMACLELVRFGFLRLQQEELFGEIYLLLREDRPARLPWEEPSSAPSATPAEPAADATTSLATGQEGQKPGE